MHLSDDHGNNGRDQENDKSMIIMVPKVVLSRFFHVQKSSATLVPANTL